MKRVMHKTETYELRDGYMVDVVTTATEYIAYLWNVDMPVKIKAFSVYKDQFDKETFFRIIDVEYNDSIPLLVKINNHYIAS